MLVRVLHSRENQTDYHGLVSRSRTAGRDEADVLNLGSAGCRLAELQQAQYIHYLAADVCQLASAPYEERRLSGTRIDEMDIVPGQRYDLSSARAEKARRSRRAAGLITGRGECGRGAMVRSRHHSRAFVKKHAYIHGDVCQQGCTGAARD